MPPFDPPPGLIVDQQDEVLVVGLDRAGKRNALNVEMIEGLERLFARPPEGVKAAVIHGLGDHFSAGLDLSDIAETSLIETVEHSRLWHRAFEKIEFGRVPVVSVLHGAVVGGGLELAASTHVRVAESSAFYALPEGVRGIFVGGGGSVRISKLIGASRMQEMMLTGRTLTAAEGLAIGLSHYVVDPGEGLARGVALARRVAENAPLTNFAIVQGLPRIRDAEPATGFLMEALLASMAQTDDEARRRLRDFLEKRAAKVEPR